MRVEVADFEKLIMGGHAYVDKTGFIHKLMKPKEPKLILLNRPRRFGKSLLLSTIKQVLLGRRDLFEKLDICAKKPEYQWKSSHVIEIQMNRFGTDPYSLGKDLLNKLREIGNEYGIDLDCCPSCGSALNRLIEVLYKSYDTIPLGASDLSKKADIPEVALLVDEYDFQFTANFNDPKKLEIVRDTLYGFYSSLKAAHDCGMVRSAFITGITRSTGLTPFFGLNNFRDITFDPKYSKICGFTRKEIKTNFSGKVRSSLKNLKKIGQFRPDSGLKDILGTIVDFYDGYSFDGQSRVLNPHSILHFLRNKIFDRYWYDTGGPGFLERLQILDKDYFRLFARNISGENTLESHMTNTLSATTALLMTGYLTIDKIIPATAPTMGKTYKLVIPNAEVRMSFAEDYLVERIYPDISMDAQTDFLTLYRKFSDAITSIEPESASNYLSSIFAGLPHQHHDDDKESFFKSHMIRALSFVRGKFSAEYGNGGGVPDFVVMSRKNVFVIEVKYHDLPQSLAKNGQDSQPKDSSLASGTGMSTLPASSGSEGSESGKATGHGQIDAGSPTPSERNHAVPVRKLLDRGIADAISQICRKKYPLEFLGQDKKVWAVAVSIVGRMNVEIRFEEMSYKSFGD
ncbi:MAG: AAA family ATPase [Deltaproteobacteria bacterium]|jgi:hypothetical protein|nr:AAA family ATPase [Deltaproteobacteria bacterium]